MLFFLEKTNGVKPNTRIPICRNGQAMLLVGLLSHRFLTMTGNKILKSMTDLSFYKSFGCLPPPEVMNKYVRVLYASYYTGFLPSVTSGHSQNPRINTIWAWHDDFSDPIEKRQVSSEENHHDIFPFWGFTALSSLVTAAQLATRNMPQVSMMHAFTANYILPILTTVNKGTEFKYSVEELYWHLLAERRSCLALFPSFFDSVYTRTSKVIYKL